MVANTVRMLLCDVLNVFFPRWNDDILTKWRKVSLEIRASAIAISLQRLTTYYYNTLSDIEEKWRSPIIGMPIIGMRYYSAISLQ